MPRARTGSYRGVGTRAGYRVSARLVRVQAWSHPSRSTAATGPRPSPRSSGRTTSPSRCGRRWPTTGSTTPTSSPARAAAARPPRARILARALNCEQAPIADPCGECDSCRDLARGGPGSIDVIEIDAASHGGVDDARDLREKAFFAPVRSRYKVYIIDEAHMVTTQGFNALLKLVEEPPPHLRFIFATTEPDKVMPTIRSRTHHYPFRLIPPRLLSAYLSELCEQGGRRDRAGRAAAGRARRRRLGPRHPLGARPAARRRRPRRRHLRAGHRACSATPPTRCSTRSSTRSRPATARRSSAWSTRSSRPARTRAGSPRTCCAGCATW